MELTIRKGTAADIPAMFQLVRELAEFEKATEEVENTEAKMLEDGFGPNPVYGSYVAEIEGEIVGMSVYYYRYSTWKGKRLFLEDLIVTEKHRGKRIGKALFEKAIGHAVENNCSGMVWQVLDWNTPAIDFYQKYSCQMHPEWVNCTLTLQQLEEIHQGI